ncbi:MAG: GSCFA domain-containing protein [Bacteroidales bacterium]
MQFRTEIIPHKHTGSIHYGTPILTVGSCFAQSIGNKLKEHKFQAMINPFGIVYNPASVRRCFEYILGERTIQIDDLFLNHGVWVSFDFHGSFSGTDKEQVFKTMQDSVSEALQFIQQTKCILLTLGTAWVYEWKHTGQIVSNCHKVKEQEFHRYSLTQSQISESLNYIIQKCRAINPTIQFVLTVSPIRHWKDGAPENSLSKAKLLLCIHEAVEQYEGVHYFPAYELLIDDLRDYRFYAPDMLHPSDTAIEYIWNKFQYSFFDDATLQLLNKVITIRKATQHKIFNPQSDSTKLFACKQLELIAEIEHIYTGIDFGQEKQYFEKL